MTADSSEASESSGGGRFRGASMVRYGQGLGRSRTRRVGEQLPTGHACANQTPPIGAVANALHALTLLIARQLVSELEMLGPDIEYFVVPPLCPLVGSPYDFSRTADHIDRAILSTDAWLAQHGLQQGKIPHEMRLHSH